MGFKLGTSRGNYADRGEIKTKLSFTRNQQATIPGTPIICLLYTSPSPRD